MVTSQICFCCATKGTPKIPFKIMSKRIKLLGINLTMEVRDLYAKNYNILIVEI